MLDDIYLCIALEPHPLKTGLLEAQLVNESSVLFVTMPDAAAIFKVGQRHRVRVETISAKGSGSMQAKDLKDIGIPQDILDAAKKLGADTEADLKELAKLCVDHTKQAISDALNWALAKIGK